MKTERLIKRHPANAKVDHGDFSFCFYKAYLRVHPRLPLMRANTKVVFASSPKGPKMSLKLSFEIYGKMTNTKQQTGSVLRVELSGHREDPVAKTANVSE